MNNPNTQIELKLHEIATLLLNKEFTKDISLMSGMAGEILFLAYYSRQFPNLRLYDEIEIRLESIFQSINRGQDNPTFAKGVSGINWMIEHLHKNNFIEFEIETLYESSDEYLLEYMMNFIYSNNYDFLHGGIGIANYFTNRNTKKTKKYLEHFIDALFQKVTHHENSMSFLSKVNHNGVLINVYNFSLSHGMTSILSFLDKCISKLEMKGKSKIIIDGLLNFYNQNKNDISLYNSYYPSWFNDLVDQKNSRISWCYGDLSIAHILLNFKSDELKGKYYDHAIDLINNTLNRDKPYIESINDSAICHGSSGLTLLYKDFYEITNDIKYLNKSQYWLNHCLNDDKHVDGMCGYKMYHGSTIGWSNETGLLEGISGIGLVLLSILDNENIGWKECLML